MKKEQKYIEDILKSTSELGDPYLVKKGFDAEKLALLYGIERSRDKLVSLIREKFYERINSILKEVRPPFKETVEKTLNSISNFEFNGLVSLRETSEVVENFLSMFEVNTARATISDHLNFISIILNKMKVNNSDKTLDFGEDFLKAMIYLSFMRNAISFADSPKGAFVQYSNERLLRMFRAMDSFFMSHFKGEIMLSKDILLNIYSSQGDTPYMPNVMQIQQIKMLEDTYIKEFVSANI